MALPSFGIHEGGICRLSLVATSVCVTVWPLQLYTILCRKLLCCGVMVAWTVSVYASFTTLVRFRSLATYSIAGVRNDVDCVGTAAGAAYPEADT